MNIVPIEYTEIGWQCWLVATKNKILHFLENLSFCLILPLIFKKYAIPLFHKMIHEYTPTSTGFYTGNIANNFTYGLRKTLNLTTRLMGCVVKQTQISTKYKFTFAIKFLTIKLSFN